jgi:hypothetical protein
LTRALRHAIAAALILTAARSAHAGPDLAGAADALVSTPFRVAGDLVGVAGLSAASVVGLIGDGVALLDANPLTYPVLHGIPSGCVRRVALALSQGSTGLMEGLRAEDIERLPEPSVAYLQNAPGAGRLDTLLTGLGSLRLGLLDALAGPALVVLRASGAHATAERVSGWQHDDRIRVLGPLAQETGEDPGSAARPP